MQEKDRLKFCPECGFKIEDKSVAECPSCHAVTPSGRWSEIRPMFNRAVCTHCYSLLEEHNVEKCPECGTTRPGNGWILLPYTIADRYRLLSHVAVDDISSTFEALDLEESRAVLIRLGRNMVSKESSYMLKLLQREEQISRADKFEACTSVVGVYNADGLLFSIQAYNGLRSLRSILRSRGRFEPDYACSIGACIADTIAMLHKNGIVHGNLTMEHIMVNPRGPACSNVRLNGLEYATYKGEYPKILPRDSAYTAPEVGISDGLCPASDCYSLAVIIWEMVTGNLPNPDDFEHRPDMMPMVLFVELTRILQSDVSSRVSDAMEMAGSIRAVSGFLSEFETVGSDCENAIKTLLIIDEKIKENPSFRKVLKRNGYTISKLDQLKQNLNQICEQVGEFSGDPKIFRDRVSQVSKHIHNVQEIILAASNKPVAKGNNKWIIAGSVGIILIITGIFWGWFYWGGFPTKTAFSSLQKQCLIMKKDVKKVKDLLIKGQGSGCPLSAKRNEFLTENQIKTMFSDTSVRLTNICNEVQNKTGNLQSLQKGLDSLRPKVNRLIHACFAVPAGKDRHE